MSEEKLYQVVVNVRAIYEISAVSAKAAKRVALESAESGMVPDQIEYAGDGIDECLEVG